MRHYPGADNQEQLASLPIDGVWRLLFSIPIWTDPGEIVQAAAEFEVTNTTTKPVGVFGAIKLQSTPSTYSGGYELSEANGHNVTPDMHHGMFARVGSLVVPASMAGNGYVNLWIRAVQTQSGLPPLVVERDFGRLFVNIFPQVL